MVIKFRGEFAFCLKYYEKVALKDFHTNRIGSNNYELFISRIDKTGIPLQSVEFKYEDNIRNVHENWGHYATMYYMIM